MIIRRRLLTIICLLSAGFFLLILIRRFDDKAAWSNVGGSLGGLTHLPKGFKNLPQVIGLGEWAADEDDDATIPFHQPVPVFPPGKPRPLGYKYKKVMVVAKTKNESVAWMDVFMPNVEKIIYTADDPSAPLHPPMNKGREAMVYLTYLIDNYDNLPDVMVFMHSHQRTWHNDEHLNFDAGEMVKRLSSERVFREGYFNMRCHWHPGCPNWMHPGTVLINPDRLEEVLMAKAWAEIFPANPIPETLAQPCCSQFALSKDRVLQIPKVQLEHYRNWLMHTKIPDLISGRLWEHMFQFAFTGKASLCPVEHVCYCDGFGVCFGGADGYNEMRALVRNTTRTREALLQWQKAQLDIENLTNEGKTWEADHLPKPVPGKDAELRKALGDLKRKMNNLTNEAIKRGFHAKNRALEAGREWKEGDGF